MSTQRIEAAEKHLSQGNVAAVIKLLGNATAPEEQYLLGKAYFRMGKFDVANTIFRAVVSALPDDHLAMYYLGLSAERLGHRDAAIRAYRAALALDPNFAHARKKLSELGAENIRHDTPKKFGMLDLVDEKDMAEWARRRRAHAKAEWKANNVDGVPKWVRAWQILRGDFGNR
jgi:tetratricopeptide (TPR) repeat protein